MSGQFVCELYLKFPFLIGWLVIVSYVLQHLVHLFNCTLRTTTHTHTHTHIYFEQLSPSEAFLPNKIHSQGLIFVKMCKPDLLRVHTVDLVIFPQLIRNMGRFFSSVQSTGRRECKHIHLG